jgi:hypothetical protein
VPVVPHLAGSLALRRSSKDLYGASARMVIWDSLLTGEPIQANFAQSYLTSGRPTSWSIYTPGKIEPMMVKPSGLATLYK